MHLALFDFDGTVTKRDSFIDFTCYTFGIGRALLGFTFLSPVLFLYVLGIFSNWKTKQIVFGHFFRNWDSQKFKEAGTDYAKNQLPHIVRSSALEKIHWHKAQGHTIALVSASFEPYLRPWCLSNEIDLIATRVEIVNEKLTGRFLGQNCYGAEKVRRVKEKYNLSDFERVYAYGDSKGDRELFEIADESHYKTFS